MQKEVKVISLGGSVIIPEKININFLKKFREVVLKNKNKYKFVVVCGGGKTARDYINGLEKENLFKKHFFQCHLGISATKLNARFMTYFFNQDTNQGIPHDMKEVKDLLAKHDIVFSGALRYGKNETSDSTSAKLARFFKCDFINITNVNGLYTKDPRYHADAKFVPEITYKEFYKIANKIKFKPGQHFILDKKAAKIIKKYKINTYIFGPDTKNLDNFLNYRHFTGTIIN